MRWCYLTDLIFEIDLQLFGGGGSSSGLGGGKGNGGKGKGEITGYLFYYPSPRTGTPERIRWFEGNKEDATKKANEYGNQIRSVPEVIKGFESRDDARKWWDSRKSKKKK